MPIDPVTIQTTIVTALALGAAAGLQETAAQAVKDAYGAVKSLIQKKYRRVDLAILEDDPSSEARQAVVKEEIAKTDMAQDAELAELVRQLVDAIEANAPQAAELIGVDLGNLQNAAVEFGTVTTTAGTGVRTGDLTGSTLKFGNVTTGPQGNDPSKK